MYILLAAAVLITVLLLIPIKAVAEKKDGFDFYIKILCFKFDIKARRRKSKKESGKPPQGKKKKFSYAAVKKVSSLSDDIKDLARFFAKRCIVVDNIGLKLSFGTGDAAQTGIATGILNSVSYGALGIIHQNVRLKKWSVEIIPDFQEEKIEAEFICIGTTRLLHIIGIGIKALKLYKKFRAE